MDTKIFLKNILGGEGYYCLFAQRLTDGRNTTKFYSDIDGLIKHANKLDGEGYNSYFALGVFREATSRKAKNVRTVKSFFFDLDVGENEDKKYNSQEEALTSLQKFCKKLSLPTPLLVNSGRGIHVYWPLSEAVNVDDWLPIARRLKALTKEHGLLSDHAVTADAARVLRVPNTHNHKTDPPTLVSFLGARKEVPTSYDFDSFADLLGEDTTIPLPSLVLDGANAVMANLMGNRESYFKDILKKSLRGDGCAQLKHIVENPNDISEPLWFNGISIIKHCVDGGRKGAHKISCGHENYDPEETDSKYDTVEYVHTCERFDENNEGVCGECKHWGKIKSPIVLGNRIKEDQFPVESNIPVYPKPYFRGAKGGVYLRTKNSDGDLDEKLIYHNDLYVVERVRDDDKGECVVMRLHLPKDGVEDFTVPLTSVTSREEFRKEMSKKGVAVPRTEELMHYTTTWVNELQATTAASDAHIQFGWKDDTFKSFILGDKQIFGDKIVHNPPSGKTEHLFHMFEPKGTLEEWKQLMLYYNRDGFELHQYIIASSFGSPLMELMAVNCASLHLYGASGVGKSTAMFAGASVWAKPKKYVLDHDDTHSSRMNRGEVYKNLPLYLDELTNAEPKHLSQLAYQLSSGKQRNRMAGGSNEERVRGEPWSLFSVSSANESWLNKISTIKIDPKAEAMRVMEHKVKKLLNSINDKPESDIFAKKIESVYGLVGTPYIQWVINNIDEVRNLVFKVQKAIDKHAGLRPEHRFWSAGVACCLSGIMIAKKLGFVEFDIPKLRKFSVSLLEENLRSVQDMSVSVHETVVNFVSEHYGSILRIRSTEDLRKGQNNGLDELVIPELDPKIRLVGRYEPDTKMLYLLPKIVRAWCTKQQLDYNSFVQDLKNQMGAQTSFPMRITKGISTDLPVTRTLKIDCSDADIDASFL